MESDLSNIYANNVRYKGQIPSGSMMSSGGTSFSRDPYFVNLEQSVFSKIADLTKDYNPPNKPEVKSNNLKSISVEDAIKELLQLQSNGVV